MTDRPGLARSPAAAGSRPRRPWHIGTYLGVSIGTYAVLLAGVTGAQSGADATLIEARRPGVEAAAELRAAHDRLELEVTRIAARYTDAAQTYERAAERIAGLDGLVGDFAATVAEVDGSTASLPTRVSLPAVRRTVAAPVAAMPTVHATTGASGG